MIPIGIGIGALAARRVCKKCGAEKPLADFIVDLRKLGDRGSSCKPCNSEYRRARRRTFVESGLELIPSAPAAAYARFDASVQVQPGDCWKWLGRCSKDGYGVFTVNGYFRAAHRFAYVRWKGPIPRDKCLDHLCRNRSCVNPDHLEIVTNAENLRRGEHPCQVLARENRCGQGHSLLDPENVIIRKNGSRSCRSCKNASWRRGYHRRKGQ